MGYDVHYDEFEGPHTVLPMSAKDAMQWLLQAPLKAQGAPVKKQGEKIIADVKV